MLRLETFQFSDLIAAHTTRNDSHRFSLSRMIRLDDTILTPEDEKQIRPDDNDPLNSNVSDQSVRDGQGSRGITVNQASTIVQQPKMASTDYDMLLTQPPSQEIESFSQLDEILTPLDEMEPSMQPN